MMYHCNLCGKNIDDDADGIYNHLKQYHGISTQRIVRLDKYMYPLGITELPSIRDFKRVGYTDKFWKKAIETRSEEHTSELQSRQYLVCRLLLEKKKEHQRS